MNLLPPIFAILFGLLSFGTVHGAVISISGVIDGDSGAGAGDGDTLDFLTFEVLSSSEVTLHASPVLRLEYLVAEYIGLEDQFGDLGNPFRLVWDCLGVGCQDSAPMILSRRLDPGVYVIITNVRFNTSYDHFDGYVPVNPEGGGFVRGLYDYSLEGDIRGIDFREGNLDGTFTFTPLPEPGSASLATLGVLSLLFRRSRPGRKGRLNSQNRFPSIS